MTLNPFTQSGNSLSESNHQKCHHFEFQGHNKQPYYLFQILQNFFLVYSSDLRNNNAERTKTMLMLITMLCMRTASNVLYYTIPQFKHRCFVPSVGIIGNNEIDFFISEISIFF